MILSNPIYEEIKQKLLEGYRIKDAFELYKDVGISLRTLYVYNSLKWHIKLTRGSSRGAWCLECKLKKPNYRQGLCHDCYKSSRRTGRIVGEKHWWWKGGKTKTAEYIRFTFEYKVWQHQ